MDLQAFRDSLSANAPPAGLSRAVEALWYEAKGEWGKAHELIQAEDDATGAWVHAYLHRKEGDASNAAYWYRRAGEPMSHVPLEVEWEQIVERLLGQPHR
jgi:hypothetical protein